MSSGEKAFWCCWAALAVATLFGPELWAVGRFLLKGRWH